MTSASKPKIDRKVARLVKLLNSLPGVFTNSSCGGHAKQTNVSQCPANEWYVDFELTPHQMAWESLGLIALVATELSTDEFSITLKVWHDGGIRFDLRGIDVPADDFASAVEQMI